ncbi:hypothetical protein GCM10010517_10480 [Streptosporangium fragile]|uniref:Uncharacterized protein n=1 Tax=Streptosporangium fragile TaxID=46186 RepID=A0ABN3VR53_9ACTN
MRRFKRLCAAVPILAVPILSVPLTGTAEALRIADRCGPFSGET